MADSAFEKWATGQYDYEKLAPALAGEEDDSGGGSVLVTPEEQIASSAEAVAGFNIRTDKNLNHCNMVQLVLTKNVGTNQAPNNVYQTVILFKSFFSRIGINETRKKFTTDTDGKPIIDVTWTDNDDFRVHSPGNTEGTKVSGWNIRSVICRTYNTLE